MRYQLLMQIGLGLTMTAGASAQVSTYPPASHRYLCECTGLGTDAERLRQDSTRLDGEIAALRATLRPETRRIVVNDDYDSPKPRWHYEWVPDAAAIAFNVQVRAQIANKTAEKAGIETSLQGIDAQLGQCEARAVCDTMQFTTSYRLIRRDSAVAGLIEVRAGFTAQQAIRDGYVAIYEGGQGYLDGNDYTMWAQQSLTAAPSGTSGAQLTVLQWLRNPDNNHDFPVGIYAVYCSSQCVDTALIASESTIDHLFD